VTTQRVYRGINIYRITEPNSWGLRWEAYVPGFGGVRADTLAGCKSLITHYLYRVKEGRP
jgi:hypothetical protein